MAILVDKNSKVIVQGITGSAGKFHTERMLAYGTNIVAGTSPGKGGQKVFDLPVYDTVEEFVQNHGADTSVVFLPARFVMEAAIEAIYAGIKFIVVVPEHIPILDMMTIRKEAQKFGTIVLGGNTAGIITPGEANLGIMPDIALICLILILTPPNMVISPGFMPGQSEPFHVATWVISIS